MLVEWEFGKRQQAELVEPAKSKYVYWTTYGQLRPIIYFNIHRYYVCVYTCVTVYMHAEVREQPQIWIPTFHIIVRVSCFVFVHIKPLSDGLVFPVIMPLGSWIRDIQSTKAVKIQAQFLVHASQILLPLRYFFSPWSNSKSEKSTEDKEWSKNYQCLWGIVRARNYLWQLDFIQ